MISVALSLIFSIASPVAVHRQAMELFDRGEFGQAAVLCRDALKRQDPSSLEAGLLLRDLSRAYRSEGYLEKALAARRQEIAIVRSRLGEENANVALALDGIGEIYFEMNRFTAARQSFQEALRIGEKSLDSSSPHLAVILRDLAAVYSREGRAAKAAEFLRRAGN